MNELEYYDKVNDFCGINDCKVIKNNWRQCFKFILKRFNVGFTDKTINSLFDDFEMDNWSDLHIENTKYKDCNKEELYDEFEFEIGYCSDRMSYDRLFRIHWLFKRWEER